MLKMITVGFHQFCEYGPICKESVHCVAAYVDYIGEIKVETRKEDEEEITIDESPDTAI